MNKIIIFLFSITMLNGYKSESNFMGTQQSLPQYNSVKELLSEGNDYSLEFGTLKFFSEDKSNLHVQVSNPIVEGDFESVIKEIVKRDIVYVAFQSFAQTNIGKLTITAVPIDLKNKEKYYTQFKKTVTIEREQAKSILKKHLNTEDFSILFKSYGTFWAPNENFNKLKFEKLNEVFAEINRIKK